MRRFPLKCEAMRRGWAAFLVLSIVGIALAAVDPSPLFFAKFLPAKAESHGFTTTVFPRSITCRNPLVPELQFSITTMTV